MDGDYSLLSEVAQNGLVFQRRAAACDASRHIIHTIHYNRASGGCRSYFLFAGLEFCFSWFLSFHTLSNENSMMINENDEKNR